MSRIVLGYAGGVHATAAIPRLAEQFHAEVVTLTLDLGQHCQLADVRERALAAGAVRAHVLDMREEFARDYVLRALQAGTGVAARGPIAPAIASPLVATRLVEMARMEGAGAIAYGGRADGAARVEACLEALAPALDTIALAQHSNIPIPGAGGPASARSLGVPGYAEECADANLWGRSVETGDAPGGAGVDGFLLTRSPAESPDEAAFIDIEFASGVPVRTNGLEMPLLEMIESVETIAGVHGVGRFESRIAGAAPHSMHEAPAAVVLAAAHDALQALVIPGDLQRLTLLLSRAFEDLIYDGLWFSSAAEAIAAFVGAIQPRVSGVARLRLLKGECRVVSCHSPNALDGAPARHAADRVSPGR